MYMKPPPDLVPPPPCARSDELVARPRAARTVSRNRTRPHRLSEDPQYFLSTSVTPTDLQGLAKWDVVVLDADFQYYNPGALDQMRALNPEIVILGYIPINGTSLTGYERPVGTVGYKYWEGISTGDFWLYDTGAAW